MEQTVISLEATPGEVIETLQIADPKDPFGVRLLIGEWFDPAGETAPQCVGSVAFLVNRLYR